MGGIPITRGTRDFIGSSAEELLWVEETHRAVAGSYGYRQVETPLFEASELFERGTGSGTDVVEKEMYVFEDRGKRRLALRPEGTPGAVRAILSDPEAAAIRPYRAMYSGTMYRHDRPQKGRYREFRQVGVEAVGLRDPSLDAEVIALAVSVYRACGVTGTEIRLNSLGSRQDRERYRAALVAYYEPHAARLCEDCARRLSTNPLRLLDCKKDSALVDEAPLLEGSMEDASIAYFEEVEKGLDALGVAYTRDPRIVRGLDYYCDTTFEVWHRALDGSQNALGGGGRYDGLAEVLGYPATPGVGYGLGIERLLIAAHVEESVPRFAQAPDALVCSLDPASRQYALELAEFLRREGLSVATDVTSQKMEKRFRYCEHAGIAHCLMVGETEQTARTATAKHIETRDQHTLTWQEIVPHIEKAKETTR